MPEPWTILVIEDNPQNLELVTFLLEEEGMKVLTAEDIPQAKAILAHLIPDLILLDIHLPGGDGLSLVQEVRQIPRGEKVPIIALTAHAMRGDKERFLKSGCDGYIAKPIDVSTFIQEIMQYLVPS